MVPGPVRLVAWGVTAAVLLGLILGTWGPASAHAILSAHLHHGTCGDLADDPTDLGELGYAAPLLGTPVPTPSAGYQTVGAADAFPTVMLVETVEESLDHLLAEPHALDVHIINDEEGIDITLSCGDVGGVRVGDDLVFGLQAQRAEGVDTTGVAWLHANGDGTTTVRLFVAQGLEAERAGEGTPTP